ncbi:MAG: response regulator [Deltaproteobacteria bacterium]|nr:response regulator [Deltaproteobacteria bacterium]
MENRDKHQIEQTQIFVARFQDEGRELLVSNLKVVLSAGALLYASFYGLDYALAPENHITFLCLRLFVVFNHLAGVALLFSKFGTKIAAPLSIWEANISTLAIAIMTIFLGGFQSNYYVGIVFVLFITGLFLTWTVKVTILNGLLALFSYFVVNVFFSPPQSLKLIDAVSPFFFIGGSVFLTAFANYSKETTRRRDLSMRMQIEKANEELKELDNAKMRFFSNVSHELRSPLTLILGPLETLLKGQQNQQDTRPLLQAMEGNARRLLRQVNTLLDFAKVDAGMLECKYEFDSIGRIIQGLATAARPHLANRKIDLVLEGIETIPYTTFDPDKVETMIANLLSNAIKFTPDGGRITMRTAEEGGIIWFEVEDTGIGIPEDKLDAVFERFVQVDDKHNRRQEGTGLGLAMVKQLAKLHAGKVTVRSKLGQGTTFRVELPKEGSDSKALERRRVVGRRHEDQISYARNMALISTAAEEKSGTQQETLLADVLRSRFGDNRDIADRVRNSAPPDAHKVLVVEDNPDLRLFIATNLADDYQVELAKDGVEGLELAKRWVPDLIVSDIMMPRMDGYELTRQVRKDPSLSQVPVILATAKSGGDAVAEGLEVGANDYLAKPFEIRELKARVSAQLRTRRLERNLSERESRLAAIGQMTSAIVHDLKNPLSSIIGFAELTRQDVLSGKESAMVTQDLEPVISEANRLSHMIAEVLDFARGSSSELNLVPTELSGYLETVCLPMKQKLAAMGIELILQHESGISPLVNIDNDRMLRVIENLIRNAQEAIWAGGRDGRDKHIWITTRSADRSVSIRIADDGPGIPPEMISNIFDAFATGKKRTGTGLGLATVRNLVIAHGGEITVEAKGAEGGAAFLFTLPKIPDEKK